MEEKKNCNVGLYAVAIAIWTLVFTLTVVGGLQFIFYVLKVEPWTPRGILIIYLLSYLIIFLCNLDVMFKDDKKEDEE